jgi:hypothetical protein
MVVKLHRGLASTPGSTVRFLAIVERPTPVVRSARLVAEHDEEAHCLACGQALPPVLSVTGSVRCQDCRESNRALSSELVEPSVKTSQAA